MVVSITEVILGEIITLRTGSDWVAGRSFLLFYFFTAIL